jgi:hypothetical protein
LLRFLENWEKEEEQKRGYMYEHLLCLYSSAGYKTALYGDTYPVFINKYGDTDVILFCLRENSVKKMDCIKDLLKTPFETLNIVSPEPINSLENSQMRGLELDYHIDVDRFDINLKGGEYKQIRYRVNRAEREGYEVRVSREFTSDHVYVLSRHLTQNSYSVWDYEELLSLERFFREHDHGFMMEIYSDDKLIGFDVVDFFEENKIMVVPLGIYLQVPGLADLMMYENLKYAKMNGYKGLDIGSDCGKTSLREFKEKWFATPKYRIYAQTVKKS